MTELLTILQNDPWLQPHKDVIDKRHRMVAEKEAELTKNDGSLSGFASGYLYFGLHRIPRGWVFREWAPNATEIFLIGNFSNWQEEERFRLTRLDNGVWEIRLKSCELSHLDLYKLSMHWDGGQGERIPAWATRVVQDEETGIFSAQVWQPENPYKSKKNRFTPHTSPLQIY